MELTAEQQRDSYSDVEIVEGLQDKQRIALCAEGQEPRDGAPVEPIQ